MQTSTTSITMKQYTQNPEFNELLNQFDQHLQNTINCDLAEYECDEIIHNNLEHITHYFYIHSVDGNILLHKLQEETENFWSCHGLDQSASGAAYLDGSLIKNNTMIIKIKAYL